MGGIRMATDVVTAIFRDGWKIVVNGQEFGSYASEEEAVLIARTWADNAREQGHTVNVVISGGRAHPMPIVRDHAG